MKRRASHIFTALSALLLIATVFLWLRSHWIADHWDIRRTSYYYSDPHPHLICTRLFFAANTSGVGFSIERERAYLYEDGTPHLGVEYYQNEVKRTEFYPEDSPPPRGKLHAFIWSGSGPFGTTDDRRRPVSQDLHLIDADIRSSLDILSEGASECFGFGTSFDTWESHHGLSGRVRSFWAPIWPLAILFAILPLARLASHFRRRRRQSRGRCPTCNYDLRHSPDRCPECGSIRPATDPSMFNVQF